MYKKISFLILLSIIIASPVVLFAQTVNITNPLNSSNFCNLLSKIGDGVGGLVASLSVIMIIISGIFYLTSAGNPERINTAKKALIYAIIGLAIAIAATTIKDIILGVIGATGGSC